MAVYNKDDVIIFLLGIDKDKIDVKHIEDITITIFVNDVMVSSYLIKKIIKVLRLFLKNRKDNISYVIFKNKKGFEVVFYGYFDFIDEEDEETEGDIEDRLYEEYRDRLLDEN